MNKPVNDERLRLLWLEAIKGLQASREDILDLIEEIQYLRVTCDMDPVALPPRQDLPIPAGIRSDPWAEEWPGNPI